MPRPAHSPSQRHKDQKSKNQPNRISPAKSPVKKNNSPKADTKAPSPVPVPEVEVDAADAVDESGSDWEEGVIFKETENPHTPDEVGRPLPATYTDEVLLPRKWDSSCIDSEFVKADNLDEYTKPVHETAYWHIIEFDPAFVRDGKFPSGDSLLTVVPRQESPGAPETPESGEVNEQRRKREDSVEEALEEPRPKRRRSNSHSEADQQDSQDDGKAESSWKPLDRKGQDHVKQPDNTVSDAFEDDYRHTNARRASCDRSRGPSGSPRSRRSSISNASSGLDSLEAELLGIDVKAKPSEDSHKRQHQNSGSAPRNKRRRQTRLDAAYRYVLEKLIRRRG